MATEFSTNADRMKQIEEQSSEGRTGAVRGGLPPVESSEFASPIGQDLNRGPVDTIR